MSTFTCVFYEKSKKEAEKRLDTLRETDKGLELKAYILCEGSHKFRVLRKIQLNVPI